MATRLPMGESGLSTQAQPAPSWLREGSALLPGTVLASRYRIVTPLGRGGMGEVYRAEDLKLGQSVALKFLPATLRSDDARRKRLRDEVKLARLVAHPNVCRMWDVIEADGLEFLCMEYVDGEDLASLLRRIGRLPEDRAVRMARELCAGLGAVHDQGIVHRDLKPANVMVDGRGRLRLADFGLASLAKDVTAADARAGTPAYMSPEQREGREVTVRSDVYALGLVLYEVFTGRPAFPAQFAEDAARRGSHLTPSNPSSHVEDLDPTIDRAIQRCLEPDPALRPPSAVAVAASLPGGDPLVAALAAGETPSPELVAAVGGVGGLRLPVAIACLTSVVLGTALVAWVGDRVSPFFLDLDKPPQVLTHEARQILADLGPVSPPADSAHGFVLEGKERTPARSRGRLDARTPQRLVFWYRQSPRRLSEDAHVGGYPVLRLSFTSPTPVRSGMAGVRLDAHGVLVEYVRVPTPNETMATTAPDWAAVLRRAGLDPEAARAATPAAIPPVFGDLVLAWDVDRAGVPIRVEAASFHGRPVWFFARDKDAQSDPSRPASLGVVEAILLSLLVVSVLLARRHLRVGRADRDGARQIATFGGFWAYVGSALWDPRVLEPGLLWLWLINGLSFTVLGWVFYLALEPIVRRCWPDTLVSWTRLLRGRLLDPLVGRDVLLGVLGGVALTLGSQASSLAEGTEVARWPALPRHLAGGWYAFGELIRDCGANLLILLVVLMLLALLRQLLRKTWAAFAVTLCVFLVWQVDLGNLLAAVQGLFLFGISVGLLIRPGLLAAVTAGSVHGFLSDTLMTTHLGAWYADSAVSAILATLALAAWGFKGALGGRPLFGDTVREAA